MFQIAHVLTDRGSRYAVSGQVVETEAEIADFLKALKRNKKLLRPCLNLISFYQVQIRPKLIGVSTKKH